MPILQGGVRGAREPVASRIGRTPNRRYRCGRPYEKQCVPPRASRNRQPSRYSPPGRPRGRPAQVDGRLALPWSYRRRGLITGPWSPIRHWCPSAVANLPTPLPPRDPIGVIPSLMPPARSESLEAGWRT